MNRTRRKAIKMFKRRYGKATNPCWLRQTPPAPIYPDALAAAFRSVWEQCRADVSRAEEPSHDRD